MALRRALTYILKNVPTTKGKALKTILENETTQTVHNRCPVRETPIPLKGNPRRASAINYLARTQWVQVNPYGAPYSKKAQDCFLCFLLVTRTGLEPMLPP